MIRIDVDARGVRGMLTGIAAALSGSIRGVEVASEQQVIMGEPLTEILDCAEEQGVPLYQATPALLREAEDILDAELRRQLERNVRGGRGRASLARGWRDIGTLVLEYVQERCARAGALPARSGRAMLPQQARWKARKYATLAQALQWWFVGASGARAGQGRSR